MTSNDTGDGMEIKDRPASWGKVKAETIRKMK